MLKPLEVIPVFPKDDPHQSLRISRFFVAFVSYVLCYLLVGVLQYGGFLRGSFGFYLICIVVNLIFNLVLYAVFRSNFNLRSKDPSMTLLQMVFGIFWILFIMYHLNEGRSILLIMFFVVFVFGLFELRSSQFLVLSFFSILLYGSVVFLLYFNHPQTVDLKLEIINLAVLALVLTWFSVFGGYLTKLRRRLKKALATIRKLAIYDELTQIYNRRHFFEILRYQKSLCDRGTPHFSLCILDLDHFKAVNDTHGHQAGDKVLQFVAAAVETKLREIDTLARYGGEEFVVLLSGTGRADALRVSERIRYVVEQLVIPSLPDDFKITTSIGISSYKSNRTLESLIHCADEALYRAKAKGRNCIEFQELL